MTETNFPSQISCPHCGQTYAMTAELWPQYQGRSIACTKCGQQFIAGGAPAVTAPPILPAAQPGQGGFPPQQPGQYPPGGPQGYYPPAKKGMSGGLIALIVIACVAVVLVIPCLIAILLPALSTAREAGMRAKCSANMRQIGMACMLYANEYHGDYPDSVQTLVNQSGSLPAQPFICPSSSDTASTATGSHLAADIDSPGHDSYVYLGKGMNASTPMDYVLLYEPMTNHHGAGMNVLYVDGHVAWMKKAEAEQLILKLQSGGQVSASKQ